MNNIRSGRIKHYDEGRMEAAWRITGCYGGTAINIHHVLHNFLEWTSIGTSRMRPPTNTLCYISQGTDNCKGHTTMHRMMSMVLSPVASVLVNRWVYMCSRNRCRLHVCCTSQHHYILITQIPLESSNSVIYLLAWQLLDRANSQKSGNDIKSVWCLHLQSGDDVISRKILTHRCKDTRPSYIFPSNKTHPLQ